MFDRFVMVEGTRTRYCLVMEYAVHGDLGAWLAKRGAQPERVVRRERFVRGERAAMLLRGDIATPMRSRDVRGRPNTLQVAGAGGGLKLMEIGRLAAQGVRVTVIGERQFWRLVEPAPPPRGAGRPAVRRSASPPASARGR